MLGDNIESLKKLPENSIDSIVTDPPYGLSFMNKKWDYDVPSVEFWKEALRVLKPGGHVLSFGGTRTYHRMVVNMEDAGFEIRDQIMWIYGSGFPKSLNIGKSFDKKKGNEREVIGPGNSGKDMTGGSYGNQSGKDNMTFEITKGSSQYEGWGTALKPANEPICLARKPLSEKTIVDNVIKWGTGGINVDGCRIEYIDEKDKENAKPGSLNATGNNSMFGLKSGNEQNEYGRFPANIIFDEDSAELLDKQSGISASRFFYMAKVSKKERNLGLKENKCDHPTLKPINLMTYLCRLITPSNGTILDPFMGSGSTGIAACLEGFNFIGMELDEDYFKIAEARINIFEEYRKLLK